MCLLGKFCSSRLVVGKQQGGRGRKFYALGTCLSGSLCRWHHHKGRIWVISRGEKCQPSGLLSENFQEIEGQPESQDGAGWADSLVVAWKAENVNADKAFWPEIQLHTQFSPFCREPIRGCRPLLYGSCSWIFPFSSTAVRDLCLGVLAGMKILTCESGSLYLLFVLHCSLQCLWNNLFGEGFFVSILQIPGLVAEMHCSLLEK